MILHPLGFWPRYGPVKKVGCNRRPKQHHKTLLFGIAIHFCALVQSPYILGHLTSGTSEAIGMGSTRRYRLIRPRVSAAPRDALSCRLSSIAGCRQMPSVIRCRLSSVAACHQLPSVVCRLPSVVSCRLPSAAVCRQVPSVVRCRLSSVAVCHQLLSAVSCRLSSVAVRRRLPEEGALIGLCAAPDTIEAALPVTH